MTKSAPLNWPLPLESDQALRRGKIRSWSVKAGEYEQEVRVIRDAIRRMPAIAARQKLSRIA
jgi:hypothetical protein